MDVPSATPGFGRFWLVLLAVFSTTLFALLLTIPDYGITWDEAEINFPAARRQVEWFHHCLAGEAVLNEEGVREYFETESDHPSLPRTLMAVSRILLPPSVPDRFAFALPTSLLVSLFTAFFWGLLWRRSGLFQASFGTVILLSHPHWFGHSHFAEYDILVAMAWFVAAMAFYWSIEEFESATSGTLFLWSRAFIAALAFGLAISVKVHAVFLPFPFLAWALLHRRWRCWRWGVLSIILAPAVYVLTQPFLWWHTVERMVNRFHDYGTKVPINVFYFGQIYSGDVPWHYPWVMLLATLPVGMAIPLLFYALSPWLKLTKITSEKTTDSKVWITFLVLNALTLPLVFSLKSAYDGVRFFLSVLPFLSLLAVLALEYIQSQITERFGTRPARVWVAAIVLPLITIQVFTCCRIHPHQLAYYSFLVGGIRGANQVGLETTYWCDSVTPKFIESLSVIIPRNARIATHSMDAPTLVEYQRMGIAPAEWRFIKEGPADCRILQFRQGFFGPMELRLFQERAPILETEIDGVPLVRAYLGP